MMLCQTNYSEERELEILNMLKMKKLDGVIICSRTNSKEKLEEYTKFGPIVMCEEIDSKYISSVHIDYYKVFSRGMKSLIDAGHTRIGYCIEEVIALIAKDERRRTKIRFNRVS